MLRNLLAVAAAGAVGATARYLMAGFVQRHSQHPFPWGTMTVNMAGCFLFGLAWMLFEEKISVDPTLRLFVLVGFLGSFTTYSSFAFETTALIRDAEWMFALLNVAVQNIVGVLFVIAGMAVARML